MEISVPFPAEIRNLRAKLKETWFSPDTMPEKPQTLPFHGWAERLDRSATHPNLANCPAGCTMEERRRAAVGGPREGDSFKTLTAAPEVSRKEEEIRYRWKRMVMRAALRTQANAPRPDDKNVGPKSSMMFSHPGFAIWIATRM